VLFDFYLNILIRNICFHIMIFSWCKMFHEYDTSCACVAIIPWTNLVTFQDFSFDEPRHGSRFSLEILPYFNLILVRKCVLGGTAGTTSTAASTRISSGRLVRNTCSYSHYVYLFVRTGFLAVLFICNFASMVPSHFQSVQCTLECPIAC
jgi:hypothetical protein